jgi:serine-type D-Ala-D-Ala carboxypeptidase (penicillin-binding protein 5/6)
MFTDRLGNMDKLKKLLVALIIIAVNIFVIGITTAGADPFPSEHVANGGSNELLFQVEAEAAILIEASTGKIIYSKNAYERNAPASVTKIMTLLLVLEAIEDGTLSWDDKLVVSRNAGGMWGSRMDLETGQVVSIKNIIEGIAIVSANDGSVAIAEHLYGTEQAFVQKMNEKAAELGMTNSNFKNTSGWPDDNHYSSARDLAILSAFAIKTQPGILNLSSQREFTFNGVTQPNFNPLLDNYEGADGLKTGWTGKAGNCFAGTVERDGLRLISVVLGSPTDSARKADTEALMNYGFNEFNFDIVVHQGDIAGQAAVSNGKDTEVDLIVSENLGVLIPANQNYDLITEVKINEVSAPINTGDVLGEIIVTTTEGEILNKKDLVAAADVERQNFILNVFSNMPGLSESSFGG